MRMARVLHFAISTPLRTVSTSEVVVRVLLTGLCVERGPNLILEHPMKRLLTSLLCLGLASAAGAADLGLGFAIQSNGGYIMVPIKLSDSMNLEGFAAYNRWDYRYGQGTVNAMENQQSRFQAGLGVFWKRELTTSTNLYLGPRISWTKENNENRYLSGNNKDSSTGYQLAPILGFEYYPIKSLSIGGEVGLAYSHLSGDNSNYGYPETRQSNVLQTVSSLMMRVYF